MMAVADRVEVVLAEKIVQTDNAYASLTATEKIAAMMAVAACAEPVEKTNSVVQIPANYSAMIQMGITCMYQEQPTEEWHKPDIIILIVGNRDAKTIAAVPGTCKNLSVVQISIMLSKEPMTALLTGIMTVRHLPKEVIAGFIQQTARTQITKIF
jgi:hypothetical protein